MKKVFFILTISLSSIMASPAVMGGITYNFGSISSNNALSGAGLTAKVLSTSEEEKPVVAAGVSYYPWANKNQKFGFDVSAGYNFSQGSVMAGWDFLQNQPSVSLGYNKEIDTSDDNDFIDGIPDSTCSSSSN